MAIVGFLVKHNFLLTVVIDPKKTYEVKKAPSNTTTVTTHSLPLTGNKSWFEKKPCMENGSSELLVLNKFIC